MDKPTKPTDLVPRSFGGVKNNFSASLQSSGYEDGVPAIYGGDNLNYQLDATGKELDYCEKICDFINELPIGKTITTNPNNKLVYTDIVDSADIDLSNLTETGEKHFLNKHQITNCLLEVPNNIKLELNNGVLTLKAGSKVIVPNGFDGATPKFDEITIQNDLSLSGAGTVASNAFIYVNSDGSELHFRIISKTNSGTSDPGTTLTTYYNTATNIITAHNQGGDVQVSFPIAICTTNASTWTSVNQVFNGFGFIGSVVFADKGIKSLIPNGRNADGSLNNTEFTTSAIKTLDITSTTATVSTMFFVGNNGLNYSSSLVYKPDENLCYQDGDLRYLAYCGRVTLDTNKKITSMIFHSGLNINALIDGKTHHITESNGAIAVGVSLPTSTSIVYDLSSFLPNTNDEYMALITGTVATGTTVNNLSVLNLSTSLLGNTDIRLAQTRTFSSSANYNAGSVWLPIGADKKISVEPSSNNTGTFNLYIRAYRKIGGNY